MSSGTENRAVILEPDIPTDCTAMPFPDVDNVILAVSGKVRISRVELYSDGSCGTRVATLVAGEPSSIGGIGAAVSYRGFLVSG